LVFANYVPAGARPAFRKDSLAALFSGLYLGAVFPFVGFLARDRLHAGVTLMSLMAAAPFVGNIFAIFWARAMTGKRKMPFAVYSWTLARSLFVLILFVRTPVSFALTIFAAQFIATISSPAYAAIMKTIYPDDQRGTIMAYARFGMAFAAIAATFAVGPILHRWADSYRIVIPVGGLLGIIAALVFSRIRVPEDDLNDQPASLPVFLRDTLGILRENRRYRWFALSVFTYGIGNLIILPLYPIYQVDVLHINATQVAVLSNLSQVVWMLSYLYWGPYVDRHTPMKGAFVNIMLTTAIPLTYIFAHNVWALWPAFVVSGIINAGIEMSYFNGILYLAEPDRIAQYQGLHSFLLGVRGTIAPFIGAAMKGAGMDMRVIFLVGLLVIVLGGAMQGVGMGGKYQRRG